MRRFNVNVLAVVVTLLLLLLVIASGAAPRILIYQGF